jgi:integrase
MVRLLIETGLRAGEAVNLRWLDIDWSAGVAVLWETKAGVRQHATLNATALETLRALGPEADGHVIA